MKYTWEEKDIKVGLFICRADGDEPWKANGWTAKWTYMIGWCPSFSKNLENSKDQYCIISMCDGMICKVGLTKLEMAKSLNEDEFIPMKIKWKKEIMELLSPQHHALF